MSDCIDEENATKIVNAQTKIVQPQDDVSAALDVATEEANAIPDKSTSELDETVCELEAHSIGQLQDYCKRALAELEKVGTPCIRFKKENMELNMDLFDHRERSTMNMALGIVPTLALAVLALCGVEGWRLMQDGYTQGTWREIQTVIGPMIPLLCMTVPTCTLIGRQLWIKGFQLPAKWCFLVGYLPARLIPYAALGSELAGRHLVSLYLAANQPMEASKVLKRLSAFAHSAESATVLDALQAETNAMLHQSAVARKYMESATTKFDNLACADNMIKNQIGREVYNDVGRALLMLGEPEKAHVLFSRALAFQPNDRPADSVSITASILGIAEAAGALGWTTEADEWLTLLKDKEAIVPAWLRPKFQLLRAEQALRESNSELAFDLLIKLKSAKINDLGRTLATLGSIYDERGNYAEAERCMRECLIIRSRWLPPGHPSIRSIRDQLATFLRKIGKGTEALLVSYEGGVESSATEETGQRSVRTKSLAWLFALPICYQVWQIIAHGLRAADRLDWIMLLSWIFFPLLFLWFAKRSQREQQRLKKQFEGCERKACQVAFKQAGTIQELLLVELGGPYSCDRFVKHGAEFARVNMAQLGLAQEQKVVIKDARPVAIELDYGIMELETEDIDLTVSGLQKRESKRTTTVMAWTLGGATAFIALLLTCVVNSDTVPNGLTAFEYYRLGAHKIERSWSQPIYFYHLDEAERALSEAVRLDPNGAIGFLSLKMKTAELPKEIPAEQVLEEYAKILRGHYDDSGAIQQLRTCIKKSPTFQWPYCTLAEALIEQDNLTEAQNILEKAESLNSNSIQYLFARAKLQKAQGDRVSAANTMKTAIEQDPFRTNSYQTFLTTELGL